MKLFRQIILLTLALLVLVSSTGMAVGMHFCGGQLRDVTLFGTKADCPMEQKQQATSACHTPEKKPHTSKGCCENHQLVIKRLNSTANDKAVASTKALDLKFLAAIRVVVLQLFAPEAATTLAYALYTSPPLARDIPVLVQSFLL